MCCTSVRSATADNGYFAMAGEGCELRSHPLTQPGIFRLGHKSASGCRRSQQREPAHGPLAAAKSRPCAPNHWRAWSPWQKFSSSRLATTRSAPVGQQIVSLVALAINPDHQAKISGPSGFNPRNGIFNGNGLLGLNSQFFGSFQKNVWSGFALQLQPGGIDAINFGIKQGQQTGILQNWLAVAAGRHHRCFQPLGAPLVNLLHRVFVDIYPFGFNQLQKDLVFCGCPGRRRSPYQKGRLECPGAGEYCGTLKKLRTPS